MKTYGISPAPTNNLRAWGQADFAAPPSATSASVCPSAPARAFISPRPGCGRRKRTRSRSRSPAARRGSRRWAARPPPRSSTAASAGRAAPGRSVAEEAGTPCPASGSPGVPAYLQAESSSSDHSGSRFVTPRVPVPYRDEATGCRPREVRVQAEGRAGPRSPLQRRQEPLEGPKPAAKKHLRQFPAPSPPPRHPRGTANGFVWAWGFPPPPGFAEIFLTSVSLKLFLNPSSLSDSKIPPRKYVLRLNFSHILKVFPNVSPKLPLVQLCDGILPALSPRVAEKNPSPYLCYTFIY